MKTGFGRHKDLDVSEVPIAYFEYISKQDWFVSVALPVRKAICERLGIPLIERPNPYRKNYGDIAKRKNIMSRAMERDYNYDEFYDKRNKK